ncbi:DUF6879 family protein [Streptacidiphilus sp. EB129]|uniref:DUF6879 family protein n=1 Tax=Streptacidiphilus sp. EB129 TaxID=3156262 RepID=UPI0035148F96
MAELISPDKINEFFDGGFERSAWRLETQRRYDSDTHSRPYQRFIAGQDPSRDPDGPWYATIRSLVATGRTVERVRLVDTPPTVGQRFLLTGSPFNIAAGEDIRYLTRDQAQSLGLPMRDFWLFDDAVIATLHFDEGGVCSGMELDHDPARIVEGCRIRDLAWQHAVRYEEFRVAVT